MGRDVAGTDRVAIVDAEVLVVTAAVDPEEAETICCILPRSRF